MWSCCLVRAVQLFWLWARELPSRPQKGLLVLCCNVGRLPLPGVRRGLPQLGSDPQHLLGAQVTNHHLPALPCPLVPVGTAGPLPRGSPGMPRQPPHRGCQCLVANGWCRHLGRGLLQFENVSYGIEPLGYSPAFEHFVYRVSDERTAGSLLANSHPESGPGRLTAEMSTKARGGDEVSVCLLSWGC